MDDKQTINELMDTLPQHGEVVWIGVRAARREPLLELEQVEASVDVGLDGDHYSGRSGKRQVTLVQAEHLDAISSMLHTDAVHPQQLRRNIVVRGINLLALKGRSFRVGDAVLEMTGLCHPCSRMEEVLGSGGYNAVRGHGGITARVIGTGSIRLGDRVVV